MRVYEKLKSLKTDKNRERVHRTFHLAHIGYLAMGTLEIHTIWIYAVMLSLSVLLLTVWHELG